MKKYLGFASIALVAMLVLLVLRQESNPPTLPGHATSPQDSEPQASKPRNGGQITVALQAEPLNLDPHLVNDAASMRILENVYRGLFRYRDTYGEIAPDLVDKWESNASGTVYRFTLKRGVTFHNTGNPLTAEDTR